MSDGYLFDEELILLSEDGANITDRNYPVCYLLQAENTVNQRCSCSRSKERNENNYRLQFIRTAKRLYPRSDIMDFEWQCLNLIRRHAEKYLFYVLHLKNSKKLEIVLGASITSSLFTSISVKNYRILKNLC